MYLLVERYKESAAATLSRIFLVQCGGVREFLCHGLEDEYRAEKVPGETRIPAGTYRVDLRKVGGKHSKYASRFPSFHAGMIWIRDVPNFQYILWHIGNFETESDGCLLLGEGDEDAMAVWSSSPTYIRVYKRIAPLISSGQIKQVIYVDP
ncbi:MAG: DUF5675 family protein [Pseudomonadota bacterium]|nr:DUF5675 family protein [Pseudomonadota bacterium]